MRISIIVPVYNNAKDLRECLSALMGSNCPNAEIIVVDDGSRDDTSIVAERTGVTLVRLEENSGVAAARNCGAKHARGEILFFVDADVVIATGAIERVVKVFEENPDLSAVFGSYDAQPRARNIVSQYRNLLHHFVHQNGNPEASTFWAGCGAVRRSAFQEIGGFDAKRFRYPSIEDIELGYRLRQAGHRIVLDKGLQGTHLKRWNLYSLIRTDISCRAMPWTRLILETKKLPNDLNLKFGQRVSFALVALACVFLVLAVVQPRWLVASAAALLAVGLLNRKLYLTFFRQGGIFFTAACIPLHLLYYIYSGLSYFYVWTEFQLRRVGRARRTPAWKFAHHRGAEKNS